MFSDIILRRSRGCFSEMPEMTTADSGRLASSALWKDVLENMVISQGHGDGHHHGHAHRHGGGHGHGHEH